MQEEKTFLRDVFEKLLVAGKVKNQFDFGNKLEYSSGYVTTAMKLGDIPAKMQKKLHEVFGISLTWLATQGKEGSMFQTPTVTKYNEAIPLDIDDSKIEKTKSGNEFIDIGHGMHVMLTPLIHEYAYAGYLRGFADTEYIEELPKHSRVVTSRHKGVYRTFVATGDSMDDGSANSIQEGDKVTGRLIDRHYWNGKLHIHKFKEFIIHHKGGIIIKEIIKHNVEKGIITIHSYNPDKEDYPDMDLSLADCKEIYNVVEVSKTRK